MMLPPASGITPEAIKVLAFISSVHGPDTANLLLVYSHALLRAVRGSEALARLGAEMGCDQQTAGWYAMEAEIRKTADALREAADVMADLTDTPACTTSLLATVPPALLGRIIRAGLECEADELLSLLECVSRHPRNRSHQGALARRCAGLRRAKHRFQPPPRVTTADFPTLA
ncbi:MAG: hypothetical protein V4675_09980 [Verrucomicrobiota bacterium]